MLVLSRRESQRIRLGDSITVTVVRVSGDKVRLGIEAPPEIRVLRDELAPHDVLPHPEVLQQQDPADQTTNVDQATNTAPTSVAV